MRRVPVAMTIAGSDSGGGAGIEADLKTFSALGVHGVVAITSITAQNTYRVSAVFDLPGWLVYEQIRVVVEDMGVDAAKTGMLSNSEIVESVARAVEEFKIPLVVDPVMIAKSGARLLREEAVGALTSRLLPRALVVTPNTPEAEVLSGLRVRSVEDAERAARLISEKYGVEAVVVKGGHLESERVVDVLYYRGSFYHYESPRVEGCTHGGGCAYSAAITAYLARGLDVVEAVGRAKEFIVWAIKYGLRVGRGHCPVNPVAWLEVPAERFRVLNSVKRAVEILLENSSRVLKYAPEVGINVVEAIDPKYATSIEDAAGVKGRVVRAGNRLVAVGPVEFGASSHLARLVLEAMRVDPSVRGAVNIRYSEELVERARRRGYTVVFVDRRREPEEIKAVEGATLPWILREAVKQAGRVPDLIYDVGDVGKEPMIRVLGKTAVDAVNKLLEILPD
jgi:hydroxymethylpyrimidine kinase/phosphomethylpyrimidine kinase